MRKLLYTVMSLVSIIACTNLRSTYEDYLGDGQDIYVGKPTDVEILPGNQRFVITGSTKYMKSARTLMIDILDTDYKFVMDVDNTKDRFEYSIDEIPAGNYYIRLSSVDKDGNCSVPDTYNVDVYDSSQTANFYAKRALDATFTALVGTMGVFFNSVDEATSVRFVYTKEDGSKEEKLLPGNIDVIYLDDWKDQSNVEVYTRIRPSATALDEIELPATSFTLPEVPEEMEIPRTSFVWPGCTTDTWATTYGGQISRLWDNIWNSSNTGYHSGKNQGVPHHITIDMGIQAALTKARIYYRPVAPWDSHPAKELEIWGHADGNPADFLEIEDTYQTPEGQFAKVSQEKGWVLLAHYFPEMELLQAFKPIDVPMDGSVDGIRYIRYRIVRGWINGEQGAAVYGMATEMFFWGKTRKIKYLESATE